MNSNSEQTYPSVSARSCRKDPPGSFCEVSGMIGWKQNCVNPLGLIFPILQSRISINDLEVCEKFHHRCVVEDNSGTIDVLYDPSIESDKVYLGLYVKVCGRLVKHEGKSTVCLLAHRIEKYERMYPIHHLDDCVALLWYLSKAVFPGFLGNSTIKFVALLAIVSQSTLFIGGEARTGKTLFLSHLSTSLPFCMLYGTLGGESRLEGHLAQYPMGDGRAAGALAQCHNRMLCVDEANRCSLAARSLLIEAMQFHSIEIEGETMCTARSFIMTGRDRPGWCEFREYFHFSGTMCVSHDDFEENDPERCPSSDGLTPQEYAQCVIENAMQLYCQMNLTLSSQAKINLHNFVRPMEKPTIPLHQILRLAAALATLVRSLEIDESHLHTAIAIYEDLTKLQKANIRTQFKAKKASKRAIAQRVLQVFQKMRDGHQVYSLQFTEIAQALAQWKGDAAACVNDDLRDGTLSEILERLKLEGFIISDKDGCYRLVPGDI
ncbi:ATPase [Perkinsela sp. CCAP 1560/4]|nr:ATPase [Perkinsela sp. CCAP 1560/4]|eukprot:KNH07346.1 ATPase [Perkinsela sp. CCAP 1560/4]